MEETLEVIMTRTINDKHQITDPGRSENTKNDKYQEIYMQPYFIKTAKKIRQGENLEISQRGNITSPIKEKG